jgi:hypothetical protein
VAKKSIGEANVKLTVEGAEQVASKLKDVKSELESTADAGKSSFNKIDDAVGKAGEKIENSTAGLRKFQGALSGIIGVVGGLATVAAIAFGKIAKSINETTEAQNTLNESIRIGRDAVRGQADEYVKAGKKVEDADAIREEAANRIVAISEESKKQEQALNELLEKRAGIFQVLIRGKRGLKESEQIAADGIRDINERLASEVEKIVEERDNRLAELEKERTRQAEEEAKKQEQVESDLADQLETARISSLEGVDRLEAEYQRRRADREQAYQEAVEEGRQREADLLDAIDRQDAQNTQNAIARIKEEEQARADAERDRQQKEQKRQEDAAARELAEALRETQRALADQAKAINDNTREVRGLRERAFNFTPDIRRVAENTSRRTR